MEEKSRKLKGWEMNDLVGMFIIGIAIGIFLTFMVMLFTMAVIL